MEAVSLDEELAAEVARNPEQRKPSSSVPMREWSLQMEALATMIDRLGDVVQAVIAVQGGKPPAIKPFPRPKTASDKLNDPRRQHQKNLSKIMIQQPDGTVLSAAEIAAKRGPGMPLR